MFHPRTATRLLAALLCVVALLAAACGADEVADEVTATATDPVSDLVAEDAVAEDPVAEDAAVESEEAMEDGAMEDGAMEEESAEESQEGMEDDAMADDADEIAMADAGDGVWPIEVAGVTIDARPERIVSLSPAGTEMLFAVGAGGQVVAVDDYSNFPAEVPVTDLSGFTPNVEAIAGFAPDLILAQAPIEGAEALGVPVLIQAAPLDLSGVYSQLEELGAATGHIGTAAEVVLQMQTEIDEIVATNGSAAAGLTYYHELDDTYFSVTSATFIGTVYSELGLINIADELDPDGWGYPQLNEEAILTADPDLIFLADTLCCGQDASTVSARPGWDQLRAVQASNIVELNDDIASRWGPRIVELFRNVAEAASQVERVS